MRSSWPTTNEPDALAPDVVHVWAVPLDGGQPPNETLLSADERRRAELFRRPELRRRFVSARVGLRTVLSRYLGVGPADVGLAFEPAGKPRLAMRDDAADRLRFNLSHSGELALVAVADRCEVGVDVERLRTLRRPEEIAERFFSVREREAILWADPALRSHTFLRCWTGKEAVLKAIGLGLGHPLDAFDAWPIDARGEWIDLPPRGPDGAVRCWLAPFAPSDAYIGAVACVASRRRVVGYTLGR